MRSDASLARVANVADELEIRALIHRYFHAIDTRDWISFRDCFAENATALYHKGSYGEIELSGYAAILEAIRGRIDSYTATLHVIGNVQVELDSTAARASSHAIANVVLDGRVYVRGLRYLDELERRGARWVIRRRVHTSIWQYEAIAVTPSVVHSEK